MKTYSDLLATNAHLNFSLELEPVGTPEISVIIGPSTFCGGKIFKTANIETSLNLLELFFVQIEIKNKIYNESQETAVIIRKMCIDGINLVPRFDYLAVYENDHYNNSPTNYLGFNGKWTLTFDRPFYQWLHQATGQGWLLS